MSGYPKYLFRLGKNALPIWQHDLRDDAHPSSSNRPVSGSGLPLHACAHHAKWL